MHVKRRLLAQPVATLGVNLKRCTESKQLLRISFTTPLSSRCLSSLPPIDKSKIQSFNNPDPLTAANSSKIKQRSWLSQKIADYAALSKFRLSSLVVLTTGAGFICAGSPIDWMTMLMACSGTALCAASAGTFNQVIEVDRDKLMKRTRTRPLPSGRVSILEANVFGLSTGSLGTSMLFLGANPTVAALGAANILLYAGPYTLSKPHSEINTWIGSLVGAIPPVMGWAAATGGAVLAAEPMALAGILFLWQFPHFFSLSWLHREDYSRGSFQMVAVNDPQGNRSADLILEYSLYLSALPIATSAAGMTSCMFAVEGTMVNLYLLYLARKFQQEQTNANARKIFLCSLWYLPVLLATFVFHSRTWNTIDEEDLDEVSRQKIMSIFKFSFVSCVN